MKGKKLLLPLMLTTALVAPTVATISQNVQVLAETITYNDEAYETEGAQLKINNVENTSTIGSAYTLPSATVVGGTGYTIYYTVTKGVGTNARTILARTSDASSTFTPQVEGYYNIKVEAVKDANASTIVENIQVYVKKTDCSMILPTNSKYVIPAVVANGTTLYIPIPKIELEDETYIEGDALASATHGASVNDFKVQIKVPGVATLTDITSSYNTTNDYFEYTIAESGSTGTYEIIYSYDNGAGLNDSLTTRFVVKANYQDTIDNMNLIFDVDGTEPTSATLGKEVTLPKIKVYDKTVSTTDEINAYTEITVKYKNSDNTLTDVAVTDYTFLPLNKGSYIVTYKAKINVFDKESATHTFTITVPQTDNSSPTVMAVKGYTVNEDDVITAIDGTDVTYDADSTVFEKTQHVNELFEDYSYSIPSKVQLVSGSATVTLPAIYAIDNYDGYEGLTFYRTISGPVYVSSLVKTPASGETPAVYYKAYEEANYTFTTTGTYTITYYAKDADGNQSTSKTYSLVVVDSLTESEAKVRFNIDTVCIKNTDTVTFNAPTATDVNDERLDIRTYISSTSGTADLIEIDKEYLKDGVYSFTLSDIFTTVPTGTFYLTAIARNDYSGNTIPSGSGFKQVAIEIRDANDSVAPTFDGGTFFASLKTKTNIDADENGTIDADEIIVKANGTVDQGNDLVYLPDATFTDADKYLNISVKIINPTTGEVESFWVDDNTALPTIVRTGTSNYTYTISGGAFKVSSAGLYKIVYQAEDVGGNITAKVYELLVNDKTSPTIIVANSSAYDTNIEVGTLFTVPTVQLMKNGSVVDGTTSWTITKVSEGGAYELAYGQGFTPTKPGTYKVTYYGEDEFENIALGGDRAEFTVVAVDTTNPEIHLLSSLQSTIYEWDSENEKVVVTIPMAYADDTNYSGELEVTYTVTNPNGDKVELNDTPDYINKTFSFDAKSQGVYTIKYYTIDANGLEASTSLTVDVGDCEAPEISWGENIPETVSLDATWSLPTDVTFTDNITASDDITATITLTGPSGIVTKVNSENKWNFNEVGSYKLKIVLKDEAGKSATYTKTITVEEDVNDDNVVTPIVGTILIVACVLVLAGVVLYFVLSANKKNKKVKPRNKK